MAESKTQNRIVVLVRRAKDLPKKDLTGHCDPYIHPCVMSLPEGDRKEPNFVAELDKSPYKPCDANPTFDYRSVIKHLGGDMSKYFIKFDLWDHDTITNNDFIGSYRFDFKDHPLDGSFAWYTLTNKKGEAAGSIEASVRQGTAPKMTEARCKWCQKSFKLSENHPKACMGGFHAALLGSAGTAVPKEDPEKEKKHNIPKNCKWCAKSFTFADNGPKACYNSRPHTALAPGKGKKFCKK